VAPHIILLRTDVYRRSPPIAGIIIIIILPSPDTYHHKIILCDLGKEFGNAGGAENRVPIGVARRQWLAP